MTERNAYNLISSEAHVVEPPDIFVSRLPASLRDRAPELAAVDGGSAWLVDGSEPVPLAPTTATGTGWHRAGNGSGGGGPVAWDDVLPALYDPAERVKAQWSDSVDAEILYPTPGLWDAIGQLDDAELKAALARAYNDWLAEFCGHAPNQLFGLAKLPTTSVDDACAELRRCVTDLGLRGGILDAWPSGAAAGGNPDDDPFWETVNELQVPISFHYGVGAHPTVPPTGIAPGIKPPMADALLPMVAAGVFDRFPHVKVVLAHGDAGWALHWMEFFDINYVRHKHLAQYALQDPDAVPSEYIRKYAWFTFHQDRPAVRNRHRLGSVHLMWASHFPFEDSNWPDNRQQAMRVTDEAPADDRHALLAGNVARLYRLPGFEKGFTDDEVVAFDQLVYF
ncbi:MAG TPA: amidohydrolase family protein [Acidimicrobiales bacterium]|nr:amidohydrolase family protein [Acidimicrobiales bacterium]